MTQARPASTRQRTVGCRVDDRLGDRLDQAVVQLRQHRPQQRHSAASLLHAALEHYLDHLDRLDLPRVGASSGAPELAVDAAQEAPTT